MNTTQILLLCSLVSSAVICSGCDPSERRVALGGGAQSPVKVTILSEGGPDGGGANSQTAAGPKITEFGTVSGKISVNGQLPNLAPLLAQGANTKDAVCSEEAVPNQSAVGENGGLANVFIYLKTVPNVDIPAPSSEPVMMDQKGCVFEPHALTVQVGQPVILKNSDPVAHNVNIKGFANSGNNTVPPNNSQDIEYKFALPERVPANVVCDFHGWMNAFVLPTTHPWAVVSSSDGTFRIENVPAGEMEFVIWHEKLGYIERSVVVSVPPNGESQPVEVAVDASKLQ